uniref:Uncharacterized protein n=1 Tax=Aegilops tauschii subsp. strangulata TaxID=200361 RepID=A0A453PFB4_AEGTS
APRNRKHHTETRHNARRTSGTTAWVPLDAGGAGAAAAARSTDRGDTDTVARTSTRSFSPPLHLAGSALRKYLVPSSSRPTLTLLSPSVYVLMGSPASHGSNSASPATSAASYANQSVSPTVKSLPADQARTSEATAQPGSPPTTWWTAAAGAVLRRVDAWQRPETKCRRRPPGGS